MRDTLFTVLSEILQERAHCDRIEDTAILTGCGDTDRMWRYWQDVAILRGCGDTDRMWRYWEDGAILTECVDTDRMCRYWQDVAILTGCGDTDRIWTFGWHRRQKLLWLAEEAVACHWGQCFPQSVVLLRALISKLGMIYLVFREVNYKYQRILSIFFVWVKVFKRFVSV
jgi:hypothetical protein